MKKMWIAWVLAIIITLIAAVYQKMTGPTYEKKARIELNGKEYRLKLPRTSDQKDCRVELPIADAKVEAKLFYDSLGHNGPFQSVDFNLEDGKLVAYIPRHDPAAKLQYYLEFYTKAKTNQLFKDDLVTIRFKGDVPGWALIPHIFFIFFAMLLSNLTGILALGRNPRFRFYGILTLIFIILGGGIFGPIVQKFAFGAYWTGIPFGWDLTDNKTLYALIFWVIAVIANRKQERRSWAIAAAIMMLIVFSIPHSLFGSTLDYTSGTVTQG